METLFLLLAGHALADFAVQPDVMVAGKSRKRWLAGDFDAEFPPWWAWLGSHALVHGGLVCLVTGSWVLGAVEVVLHAGIDHLKCEGRTTFNQDQLAHMACKIAYLPFA